MKAFLVIWALMGGDIADSESKLDQQNVEKIAQVNINQADASTLAKQLQGCTLKKANKIIRHRDKHGPFQSLKDLAKVDGISERLVMRNKSRLRF